MLRIGSPTKQLIDSTAASSREFLLGATASQSPVYRETPLGRDPAGAGRHRRPCPQAFKPTQTASRFLV
jgi:hypothetical protein